MSRVPALIDAVTGRLALDVGLKAVRVTDGPEVSEDKAREWILVGYDGDPEGEFQSATTEEDWASLSTSRSERIELPLTVLVRRGDTDVKAARVRIYEIAAVIRAVFRNDPTVGLPGTTAAITGSTLYQAQTVEGIQARLLLTVGVETFT
ncbi:hypothetical protein ABZ468_25925 [Streptomyces sp. NPDC005708]|uniref:hypothetical protein n=1 Tax=Streptomyces sp. NPDC005708 TaxID=3154564 RepID=UPI0033F4E5D9